MELAGFKRLFIPKGETRTVVFEMNASQTAFLDENKKWVVEEGILDIMIGASSNDIRLKDKVRITGTQWIDPRNRGFYAKAYVRR